MLRDLIKAFYIAKKDAKVYYFKAPNLTYGFMIPISLFIAFSFSGQVNPSLIIPGLTSLVILFGTTSIEAVAIVLEKQTGTFERLLAAPVSPLVIILGKTLAGLFFGLTLAIIIVIPLSSISGVAILNPILAFIAVIFSSLTFSALGVLISTYAKWVPEAQMLSNFIRFPMAFLSGVFLQLELLPSQLRIISYLMPLTYSTEALRISINGPILVDAYLLDISILALTSIFIILVSVKILQRMFE